MRLQDRINMPTEHGPLRTGLLTHNWRHTDPEPDNLREVRIHGTSKTLTIQCFGTGVPVPLHSPTAPADTLFAAHPGSGEAMAFFAEINFGHMVSRFQGNVNLGLLVLAGFHDFKDGSSRSNYFSREFFYSVDSPLADLPSQEVVSQRKGTNRLDTSALLGYWRNTNAASQGVAVVEIRDHGEQLGIRAHGVGESGNLDWGEVAGRAYAKDCFSTHAMAFSVAFTRDGICCHLQANVKQGVLVIAYFTEFLDSSGRSNYFGREFYYKEK
jgi:hypothetical protein